MRTRRPVAALSLAVAAAAAFVVVPASPAGAGMGCHQPGVTDEAAEGVAMSAQCFTPTVVRVAVGGTVTFRNDDPVGHMVTGAGQAFGDFDELLQGDSVSHTFADPGVFPYHCVLHPGMIGAVVVGDSAPTPAAAAVSGSPISSVDGGGNVGAVAAGAAAVLSVAALAAARRRSARSIVPSPGA